MALAFLIYMLCAAFGITAFVFAIPYAYDILRIVGALYLLYLAWQAVKPKARSVFALKDLPEDSPRKLFIMGFVTSFSNPKVAIIYLSLLPQFIVPDHGSILAQSLFLGTTQIIISVTVNSMIIAAAGSISALLISKPRWQTIQRWVMGTVLAGLAVRMVLESRK